MNYLLQALLTLAVAAFAYQGNAQQTITLTDDERQLVKENNDFAFRLFQKARGDESLVLSPLSITYALGMLNNGADGPTRQQICNVLGFGQTGQDAINAFCRKMLTEAPLADKDTKALIANTIFLNQQHQLKPEFVELAQQYYDATPQTRNFSYGETLDAINQWASDHTMGMIPKILTPDEFNADAVSYLMNAIYFKGTWTNRFDPEATVEEPFNGGAAEPMMHTTAQLRYTENDLYQAVRLPYGNEAYSMSVFLPRQGKSISDVLQALTDNRWRFFGDSYDVLLSMPRFETDASIQLNGVMANMGMPDAFNPYLADFSRFCETPTYIAMMKQAAKIKVDEQGTEAAAVTIIGNDATAMPEYAEFKANRPFLYIISEQSTGAIFFMGQFMGQFTAKAEAPKTEGVSTPDVLYNLNGQQLTTPPARGIYLKNGKKIATGSH